VSGLAHEAHATSAASLSSSLAVAIVACGYVALVVRQRRNAVRWSGWRVASFLAGCGVLAVAVLPSMSPYPAGDLRGHMLQHLLIGMVAPTGLALGAPASLLLRSLPLRGRRAAAVVLRSRVVHILTHAATVLTLNIGGLVILYATPLRGFLTGDPVMHHLVHLHFLVSGYLFAWLIAGRDPVPRRPSVQARLVLLGVAIAAHSVLSQLMYAGVLGATGVPADQLRGAATLMYYGGDLAELALTLALLATWRPQREPRATRTTSTSAPGEVLSGSGRR
jgi:putative membrane protein